MKLSEFFPSGAGVQQKSFARKGDKSGFARSPGGVSFELADVTAVVAQGEPYGYLDIFVGGGKEPIRVTFHRNVDGGPAPIYEIARNIEKARRDCSNDHSA